MIKKSKYRSPNEYTQIGIIAIPAGVHRVKIIDVTEKEYGYSGISALEITLKVSGRHGLLWYRLVFDPDNEDKTNQRITSFFKAFSITDFNIKNYKNWIGKEGVACVKHTTDSETGLIKAFVCYWHTRPSKYPIPPFRDVATSWKDEFNTKLLEKYLNTFDSDKLWIFYRFIIGTKVNKGDIEEFAFISESSAEYIRKTMKQECDNMECCFGYENCSFFFEHYIDYLPEIPTCKCFFNCEGAVRKLLINTILKCVEKNLAIARNVAICLSKYGFERAIGEICCEGVSSDNITIFGNNRFERYYTEEYYQSIKEEEELLRKEFEEYSNYDWRGED